MGVICGVDVRGGVGGSSDNVILIVIGHMCVGIYICGKCGICVVLKDDIFIHICVVVTVVVVVVGVVAIGVVAVAVVGVLVSV